MPSEYNLVVISEVPASDAQPGQSKLCSQCHTFTESATFAYVAGIEGIVCSNCEDSFFSSMAPFPILEPRSLCTEPDLTRFDGANLAQNTRRSVPDKHEDSDVPPPQESDHQYHGAQIHSVYTRSQTSIPPRPTQTSYTPSPLTDITRIRIRSQGHHCLYPGATFEGTQKSGRNSYDVNVTIVDVDFNSSFLCGYLRIRGLTDDWPELTTYFDAEIIGNRYGFLTQNWGATEQEDMVHWSRFPAFRHVKNDLKRPLLTMPDRDRGAVFMRWKERFLVPDHRVHDINGASFAGFYYVCVDFNPPATSQPLLPLTKEEEGDMEPTPEIPTETQPLKIETIQRSRRDSSTTQRGPRSPSSGRRGVPTASMNGFYFHQNSEPYQQLSLCHVPESSSSSFEFR